MVIAKYTIEENRHCKSNFVYVFDVVTGLISKCSICWYSLIYLYILSKYILLFLSVLPLLTE